MCGIVVGLSFGKLNQKDELIRQRLLRYFTTELLVRTEERGKDATGAAILFEDGKYVGLKRGETVSDFVGLLGETKDCFGSLLKVWKEHDSMGKIYLGHCRQGTIGDKEDNENNHPIKIGNLIGIHNGVIKNHDEIFENLGCKRDGEVDSEAIFRLFEHYTNSGKEPFTMDMIQSVVKRLEGQYAVTLFNADNVEQVPVFRDNRPVEFVLIKPYGILLIISEEKFWNKTHFAYERMVFYNEELMKYNMPSFLEDGIIVTKMLPDDSAIIFDLSIKVTADTKIDDLGEWKKMDRGGKIWQVKTKSYSHSSGYTGTSYSYGNYSQTSYKKKEEEDKKKRRVFDNLTKSYKVKVGDKVLEEDQSSILPVVIGEVVDADKVTTIPIEVSKVVKISEGNDIDKEDMDQKPSESVKIKDVTVYDKTNYEADKKPIISPEGSDESEEGEIIEIDMPSYPPAIVEAAEAAYTELKTKGYSDINEVLNAVDIKDVDTAETLGITVVTNRAFKVNWKAGFIAGMMAALYNPKNLPQNDIKSRRREKHIAGLKSMIILLAKFYNGTKYNSTLHGAVREHLAEIAMKDGNGMNMDDLQGLFNNHEKTIVEGISKTVRDANKYAKN